MRKTKKIDYFIIIFFAIVYYSASAQDNIYKITVDGKKVFTGFKVAGKEGIITTLHGVIGFQKIIVSQLQLDSDKPFNDGIKIISWDKARDICIISSKSISTLPKDEGYKISKIKNISNLKGVEVVVKGFPLSMPRSQEITPKLDGSYPEDLLQNLLPPDDTSKALTARNSPVVNQIVLNLHGNIYPGHSGSPVLYKNEVIGIVNGGLLAGSGFAWAIKYSNIDLVNFVNGEQYKSLIKTNSALFSNEPFYTSNNNFVDIPNQTAEPVIVKSVKLNGTSLNFHLLNNSSIDLSNIFVYVRYYNEDLSEILGDGANVTQTVPLGQSAHIVLYPPNHVSGFYTQIQYDIVVMNYPENGTTYKRTYFKEIY